MNFRTAIICILLAISLFLSIRLSTMQTQIDELRELTQSIVISAGEQTKTIGMIVDHESRIIDIIEKHIQEENLQK